MKITQLFTDILKSIKNSLRRFPLTIAVSTACAILLIYISELGSGTSSELRETLGKVTMVLALGIPLSLCIKLYFERLEEYKKTWIYAAYACGAVLLIFYYFFFLKDFEMVSMTRYIGFSLILYLIFLFMPYLPKRDGFELYVIKVFTGFFTTVLYSVVLYLGLAAILFTIDKLLGIHIRGEIYYYSWIIVIGVFAPSFFLAGLPQSKEILTLNNYTKLIKILILYIIMPLISAYTIILYIYFVKVIIIWKWPQGLVSHLVLWYSVISATVLFLISPLFTENTWVKRFMQVFPKVILPLIIMMFFSIGIRINAYGVTENRYFVVILGIWVFLVMLYFGFMKNLRNIALPILLAVITFVSIFGPLSSYSISKYSQNKRLEKILIKNNMLKDNKAVRASSEVPDEDVRNISSILNYFHRNHSLEDIKVLPEEFEIEDMEKVLGVKYREKQYVNNKDYFFFTSRSSSQPIQIRGYDYLFDSRNGIPQGEASKNNQISISFDYELSMLRIVQYGEEIYSRDLGDFTNILVDKYGYNNRDHTLSQEEMSFQDENDKLKVKIQFFHISGNKDISTDKIESKSFEFYVFVKEK